jgi:hypothetical protein
VSDERQLRVSDTVRIAGGQGFYGDTPAALDSLLGEGVDYLCLEALAELTLAILQKDRARDETLGYTRDLPAYLTRALPSVVADGMKVITNAGGINPAAATRAAVETARGMGMQGVRIATVLGDDLTGRIDVLHRGGESFAHRDTDAPFAEFPGPALFASAYLGAAPIVAALRDGADVVITGRVADASLFLAAAAHAHDWALDDWDRMAAGIVIGHLLECSGQSLGGNYSGDWWAIPHPWDLPYPIAEVAADGSAIITKPAGSGGRVSFDTLRHQLLYEVADPSRYYAPDVIADFTSAQFEEIGPDRVRVSGVRGEPVSDTYKALFAFHAGWSGESKVAYGWPDAAEKALSTAAVFAKRVQMAGHPIEEWCTEMWGVDALGGPTVPVLAADHDGECEPPEVVVRVAWRCADQRAAAAVSRELPPLALGAPAAGMTGSGRGGGGVTELLGIWPTLVERSNVDSHVRVLIEEVP